MIKQLRSFKIPLIGTKVAVFDLASSMVMGWFIAGKLKFNRLVGALLTIPLGFIVHEIVRVETPLNTAVKKQIKK